MPVLRFIIRAITLIGVAVLVSIVLFLAAAGIGAAVKMPEERRAIGGDRFHIFVLSNGFHTDIALPVVSPPINWRMFFGDHPGTVDDKAAHVVFGWGSRTAYAQTLAITDLSFATIVKSLAADDTVMHVVPAAEINPDPESGVHRIALDDDRFAALTKFVRDHFATDAEGRPILIEGATHGYGDRFFEANGKFTPFRGCNVWTGEALRAAGVSMGYWTLFAQSVTYALDGRIELPRLTAN